MRRVLRAIGRGLLGLVVLTGLLVLFGPYEPDDLGWSFDDSRIGPDVDAYLERIEAGVPNLRPQARKRIVWAGDRGATAPLSLVYLHGFSATSEEIRPVPDRIAAALGANLVYTRLTGHGRDGAAMAEADVAAWMRDTAEALALARRVGERVVILSTSTGGTLAAAAAVDRDLSRSVAGIVLVSPNFGINTPLEPLLSWPAARYWLPPLAGRERRIDLRSPAQGEHWTTTYPSVAVMPLAALVAKVRHLDFSQTSIPALFIFSDEDEVVQPARTRQIAAIWGGGAQIENPVMGEGDDPYAHVITGDIMSPGQTQATVDVVLSWLAGLEL